MAYQDTDKSVSLHVLVNAKANPDAHESYRKLQQLTPAQPAQLALFARYDKYSLLQ